MFRILEQELFLQSQASCCEGISLSQCLTLLEIERNREISVTDLAQKLSLDKSTVSRTVDGLVNIDLVNRTIPRENSRMELIHLTDAGQQMCSTINYNNDSYVKEILQHFSEVERDQLLKLFSKLALKMTTCRSGTKKKETILQGTASS